MDKKKRSIVKTIVLSFIGMLVLVVLAMTWLNHYGNQNPSEDQYIEMLDHKDKDKLVKVKTVYVDVKDVKKAGPFGWCVYGQDGGLWVSKEKPDYNIGDEVQIAPLKTTYTLGNWITTYHYDK